VDAEHTDTAGTTEHERSVSWLVSSESELNRIQLRSSRAASRKP
jgi:hypothetical protein